MKEPPQQRSLDLVCFSTCAELPLRQLFFAQAAKAAGYATTHIGKWHLGDFFYKGKTASPSLLQNDAYLKWCVLNLLLHVLLLPLCKP